MQRQDINAETEQEGRDWTGRQGQYRKAVTREKAGEERAGTGQRGRDRTRRQRQERKEETEQEGGDRT
jgi:hypothetical protein